MSLLATIPRKVLLTVAVLFAAATSLFSVIWIVYVQAQPSAQLGIDFHYAPDQSAMWIKRVHPGSAAEAAGLRAGDGIIAINGRRMTIPDPFFDAVTRGQPGDTIQITLLRKDEVGGQVHQPTRMAAPATLRRYRAPAAPDTTGQWAQTAALELVYFYPVLFLVVGCGVLFQRVQDRNAWLLALVFASFIAAVPMFHGHGLVHPALRSFALAYKVAFTVLGPAVFYFFFAVFPTASPLERRVPRLKWSLLGLSLLIAVPMTAWTLAAGGSQALLLFFSRIGVDWSYTATGAVLVPRRDSAVVIGVSGAAFTTIGLGLLSLVWNALSAPTREARRKIRVIVWGTLAGLMPILLLWMAAISARRSYLTYPFWVWMPTVLASFLLPFSFAYAVVRHRVMEIPVLLKRSARYLLVQRGFLFLMAVSSVVLTKLFIEIYTRLVQPRLGAPVEAGVGASVGFGVLLAWTAALAHKRVTPRIDRAFFRSAYDARQILQKLVEESRVAVEREQLSELLERELREAFHPKFLSIYSESEEGRLAVARGWAPAGMETLSAGHAVLVELAKRGQPWDVPPVGAGGELELGTLAPLEPDCLVPILGRDARLAGLIVLGPRLSEEPYSGEDLRLLASVASQAGIALESIRLVEKIAAQREAERRNALEIEIATQVQARLFPQTAPPLETLEYAGACLQARAVGGDYYDFLDLGHGRVGLVLADISGKGIFAALLMANLQANLRSQYAVALEDPARLLESVNRQFCQSTGPSLYATMFFATYDDRTRRMRYANCGHNPPLLLRAGGAREMLHATSTVLGLFPEWTCELAEVELQRGDTLVVYSDGVIDAATDAGERFDDQRLLQTVAGNARLPVAALLETIVKTVREYSGREQEDDITLLIARGR